jgi:coenzyme F420-reducing hydrogenase delta subunit
MTMTDKTPTPLKHVGIYDKRTHVAVPIEELYKIIEQIEEVKREIEELQAEVEARYK